MSLDASCRALIASTVREVVREELQRCGALRRPVPAAPAEALLGVPEVAQRLGLAKSTVYKRAQACELPSVKVGTRVLFRPADLDAYAEARRRSPERVRELAEEAKAT